MIEVKVSITPEDPRFAAVLAAILGGTPVAEATKAAKTKPVLEKPVIPAPEAAEAQPEAPAEEKPVTLEAIREKITEYTGKDKAAYTPKIKALLEKYGQKSASNLLKTDYEAFYTELKLL